MSWSGIMEDALILQYTIHWGQAGNKESDKSIKPHCWGEIGVELEKQILSNSSIVEKRHKKHAVD